MKYSTYLREVELAVALGFLAFRSCPPYIPSLRGIGRA